MKQSRRGGKSSSNRGLQAQAIQSARRKIYVFLGLVGLMTFTAALLLIVRPEPATAESAFSLLAADASDRVFATRVPLQTNQWRHVFVHHSRTPGGNASALAEQSGDLADHFVIGNGDGCRDGEIQVGRRWDRQLPAGRLPGIKQMDPNCVSICLIGDFDHAYPTPAQMQQLNRLLTALHARLQLPNDGIWMSNLPNNAAGVGRYFPMDRITLGIAE